MRAILHQPPTNPLTPPIAESPTPPLEAPTTPLLNPWAMPLTLACDVMFLLIAVGAGLLLHALVVVVWPTDGSRFQQQMVEWMPFWATTTTAAWYLFVDSLRCWLARRHLPFNYPLRDLRRFYGERAELILGTIAAHLLLLCLCLLMPRQPLISKLFLSGIVAVVAYAVRQSIPSRPLALTASTGVFSFAMFIVTIAGQLVR